MKTLRLLLLAIPVILTLASLPACDEREAPLPKLRVLFTGSLDGYLEPCGCVAGRQGGVDRISAYVEAKRAEEIPSLFLDVGDMFVDEIQPDPFLAEQLPLKVDALLEIWGQLGCDGKAVGDLDLSVGIERLAELGNKHGVPLLCSNLKDPESGSYPFERTRIVEVGGLRVGLLSVLGARVRKADIQDARIINVQAEVERQGYRLEASNPVIRDLSAELRSEVDYVILLSHAGYDRNLAIAERFPDIDLIVGAHWDSGNAQLKWVGNTAVATCVTRGSRVDQIDLWYDDPKALGDPDQAVQDWSAWLYYEVMAEVFARGRQMLDGREAVYGSDLWFEKMRANTSNFGDAIEGLTELGERPAGAVALAHAQMPMFEGLGRREDSLAVIDDYHDRLESFWSLEPQDRIHPTQNYVGAEACAKCHQTQYEFWRGTRHARAYSTLEASQQQFDAECYACHTVGAQLPRGFSRPNQADGFENVQCEVCHGSAGWHLKGGSSFVDREGWGTKPANQCAECHNKQHDPDFQQNVEAMLAAVSCPPMALPGKGGEGMRGAYLIGARALAQEPERRWDRIVRSYVFAGEFESALEASERWIAEDSRSLNAQLNLGARLVDLERYEEARVPLRKVLARRYSDPDAHRLMARALAEVNPDKARVHMKEALSMGASDPVVIISVARASAAAGDRLGALDLLRSNIELRPELRGYLQPVLDELSGLTVGD